MGANRNDASTTGASPVCATISEVLGEITQQMRIVDRETTRYGVRCDFVVRATGESGHQKEIAIRIHSRGDALRFADDCKSSGSSFGSTSSFAAEDLQQENEKENEAKSDGRGRLDGRQELLSQVLEGYDIRVCSVFEDEDPVVVREKIRHIAAMVTRTGARESTPQV